MSKVRKLMVVGAMALMMLVVALPSALAQDWCYGGCDPYYWGADYWSAPTETAEEDGFVVVAEEDDCWLIWDPDTEEYYWVCEVD